MAIADADLELLETCLDGALNAVEARDLARRLSEEAELSVALEDLQSQRIIRQAVWSALEPEQTKADQLTWRIRGVVAAQLQQEQRQATSAAARRWGPWQVARIGSAAVACVMIGFFVGWVGRGRRVPLAVTPGDDASSVVVDQSTGAVARGVPMVPVADEYGRVVTFQPFKNTTEAKAFYEDLNRARGGAFPAPVDDKVKLVDTPAERPSERF